MRSRDSFTSTRLAGVAAAVCPGTRPALTIAPGIRGQFAVDHATHDTTSILATIEHRFGVPPVSSRDAAARDMWTVFEASPGHRH